MSAKKSIPVRVRLLNQQLPEYRIVRILGQGAFGVICLPRSVADGVPDPNPAQDNHRR